MPDVTVILNEERMCLSNDKNEKARRVTLQIDDNLFEIALRKGLIEKTSEGYIFIGDFEELIAFKTRSNMQMFIN
jgi:hypothetical protein